MRFAFLTCFLMLISCANQKKKILPEAPSLPAPITNRELWLNRSGDELLLHPIYASLPLESRKTSTGIEVKSFRNSGGTVTNQSCSISNYYAPASGSRNGYGMCHDSRVEISCNHVFYVKSNKINDYKTVGQCNQDRFDFRPHDQNGNPVVTESEKNYLKKLDEYNKALNLAQGEIGCAKTSDCYDGMSCKDNKCQSLGIWGRIFNH